MMQHLPPLAAEALYAAKERGRNRTVIMDREYETLTTGAFRIPRTRGEAAVSGCHHVIETGTGDWGLGTGDSD